MLCCISTGVFMFPNQRAAEIAGDTVRKYLEETGSQIKVIFNVFKDIDLMFYRYYLGEQPISSNIGATESRVILNCEG